jgi:hypothetical protein
MLRRECFKGISPGASSQVSRRSAQRNDEERGKEHPAHESERIIEGESQRIAGGEARKLSL